MDLFISVTFCTFTLQKLLHMSEITLESLQKEYTTLYQRLTATANMIAAYGGEVPGHGHSVDSDYNVMSSIGIIGNVPPYPKGDITWKEKIIYVIQRLDSATSGQISDYIIKYEPHANKKLVKNMVMQTASAMAIGDKAELIATKSGRKNTYSLK